MKHPKGKQLQNLCGERVGRGFANVCEDWLSSLEAAAKPEDDP